MSLTVGSVCSGIGAPETAWAPLSWDFLWTAEIEPFPSAVLAARLARAGAEAAYAVGNDEKGAALHAEAREYERRARGKQS